MGSAFCNAPALKSKRLVKPANDNPYAPCVFMGSTSYCIG